jgi:hypothetical protein
VEISKQNHMTSWLCNLPMNMQAAKGVERSLQVFSNHGGKAKLEISETPQSKIR